MTKPAKIDGHWLQGIVPKLPCYFTSATGNDEVSVVPMHNKAGGTAMKSEFWSVLPCQQELHALQHTKLGFYGMIGQVFDGRDRERIMRNLCNDAGTLIYIKYKLGVPQENWLTERSNAEAILRLHKVLR